MTCARECRAERMRGNSAEYGRGYNRVVEACLLYFRPVIIGVSTDRAQPVERWLS